MSEIIRSGKFEIHHWLALIWSMKMDDETSAEQQTPGCVTLKQAQMPHSS